MNTTRYSDREMISKWGWMWYIYDYRSIKVKRVFLVYVSLSLLYIFSFYLTLFYRISIPSIHLWYVTLRQRHYIFVIIIIIIVYSHRHRRCRCHCHSTKISSSFENDNVDDFNVMSYFHFTFALYFIIYILYFSSISSSCTPQPLSFTLYTPRAFTL